MSVITIEREGRKLLLESFVELTEQKKAEEARDKLLHDMTERVKELDCLYAASSLLTQVDKPMNEILKDIVDLISPAWQYPEITCAKIVYGEDELATPNFKETTWCQSSDIMISAKKVGSVEVCYLSESPHMDEGPFSKEERDLIDDLGRQIGIAMERSSAEKETKEQLRKLEIFYKASIGREERILELKKQVEQLEKKS